MFSYTEHNALQMDTVFLIDCWLSKSFFNDTNFGNVDKTTKLPHLVRNSIKYLKKNTKHADFMTHVCYKEKLYVFWDFFYPDRMFTSEGYINSVG